MAMMVAAERGFITRDHAVARMLKIVRFLPKASEPSLPPEETIDIRIQFR
jgi:hypothetical protein